MFITGGEVFRDISYKMFHPCMLIKLPSPEFVGREKKSIFAVFLIMSL